MTIEMTLGFERGTKVVPKSKSVWSPLEECGEWEVACNIKKPFLFVVGEDTTFDTKQHCLVLSVTENADVGNFYLPADVEIYQEPEEEADANNVH